MEEIAAIDVGSNGIRMVVGQLEGQGPPRVVTNYRESVRLGQDVFTVGRISQPSADATLEAFGFFKEVLEDRRIRHYRAVATSAMREASNGRELVRRIARQTGIRVEVINGLEEAELIFQAVATRLDLAGKNALLIDMGGGSVEVTVSIDGRPMGSESLRLGPVRLMQRLEERAMDEADGAKLLKPYKGAVSGLVRAELGDARPDVCIGTGGNIECMAKLRGQLLGKKKTDRLKPSNFDKLIDQLLPMSLQERIDTLSLRPDRADVIALAAMVVRMIVKETRVPKVLVPGVGLREGLLLDVARRLVDGEQVQELTSV